MRRLPLTLTAAPITLVATADLHAQAPAFTRDLLSMASQAEEKFVALANTFSPEQYAWRPAEGVRSVQEVLLHVAVDNYFIPAALGVPAPAETRVTATDYGVLQEFEKQKLDKEATIAAIKKSFEHFRTAYNSLPQSRMNEPVKVFGMDMTVQSFMVMGTTHMHEHLGQLVAYARTNGVKPPWTR